MYNKEKLIYITKQTLTFSLLKNIHHILQSKFLGVNKN